MSIQGSPVSPWDSDEIVRAELFSSERLEQHAASLAAAQQVTRRRSARRSLVARLKDNESALLAAYRAIGAAVGEGRSITPAAEWLLDNYHLVEEQIREIRADLPPDSIDSCQNSSMARLPASSSIRTGLGVHRPQRQPLRS